MSDRTDEVAAAQTHPTRSGEWLHRAFISYSKADRALATSLQNGLEQLAKPYRQRRIFDVFLDTDDIPGGGNLPGRLEEGLNNSEFLVLVASHASAEAYWVNLEIEKWLERSDTDHIIIALADGELTWQKEPLTDARPGWAPGGDLVLPAALRNAFTAEPVWVDFREQAAHARDSDSQAADRLTLDDAAFKLNVARLQAPLRGPNVKPSDIVGEDLELWRSSKRRRKRAIAALTILTVASILAGVIAVLYAQRSAAQQRTALSRQLAGQSVGTNGVPLDLGLLLSIEGYRTDQTPEALGGLIGAATRADDIERILHGHDRPLRSVAFNQDGSLMASTAADGSLALWDGESFEQIGEPSFATIRDEADPGLRSLAFSPTEELLAAGSMDGRIHLWDVSDPGNPRERSPIQPNPDSDRSIVALAFDPDGSSLVSADGVAVDGACPSSTSEMHLADMMTGTAGLLGDVPGCVAALAFSPTEPVVASAGSDGNVMLWDVDTRTPLATVPAHTQAAATGEIGVTSVAFSADGTLLATAGRDQVVKVWAIRDLSQPISTFRGNGGIVRSIAFSADGSTIASGDRDGQVLIWNPNTGEVVQELSASHVGEVRGIAFHPTRSVLASASTDRTVVIWTLDGGSSPTTLLDSGTVRALVDNDDRAVLVAAGSDAIASPTGVGDGGLVRIPIGQPGSPDGAVVDHEVRALALDPATGVLAIGDTEGTVTLLDPATKIPMQGLGHLDNLDVEQCGAPTTTYKAVMSLAFDPSSSMLAVGFRNGTIVVLDAPFEPDGAVRCYSADVDDRPDQDQPGAFPPVWDLTFSPDGRRLAASGANGKVLLWDIDSGEVSTVVAATETVTSVEFSPTSGLMAVGDNSGVIVLFDVNANDVVGQPMKGHNKAVQDLAFRPGGSILASAGSDGAVVLWDTATRLPLTERLIAYEGNAATRPVFSIAWLKNGAALAAGGDGGAVLWDFRPTTLRSRACAAANRNMSTMEWDAFVGSGRSYRATCDDYPSGVGAE